MFGEIFIIVLLILFNGLLSMAEISIISSRKTRLELKAKKGNTGARLALDLANNPGRFLSTVQIGITLVGILTGIFSGATITIKISEQLRNIGTTNNSLSFLVEYGHSIAVFIVVVAITFFTLVFGELLPKRIGMSKPEAIAQYLSPLMTVFLKIATPFSWLLSSTSDVFIKIFRIKTDESKVTEEEIKAIIDEGATSGAIEEIEQDIVERVFHLGDKRVGALMTPSYEITWLDINEPVEDNLQKIIEYRHSVYPVCEEDLDKMLGIISVKDIIAKEISKEAYDLKALISPVNYFPENMPAYIALEKFKESKIHQAVIIDEYGSVIGMVTINDLFDALVGDISQDDDGSIAYELVEREDGSWIVDGQYPWDDFLREFEVSENTFVNEGFHTIGGFIMHEIKELPKTGQIIEWNKFIFEVVDMDGNRIDKIIFKINT